MSKFIDQIETYINGQVRDSPCNISASLVVEPTSPYLQIDRAIGYTMNVSWTQAFYCRPEDKQYLVEKSIQQLRDDIFGDLRKMLYNLEKAVYSNDFNTAKNVIHDMNTEIRG